MARLDFFVDDHLVMRVALGGETTIVGRHKWCEIQLPDPAVSRFQVKITSDGRGGHEATNLSTHGTGLNAAQLEGPVGLREGDVLTLGSYRMVYYTEEAPPLDEEYLETLHPG